ncbi:MAG: 2-phospho-L-lactate transferase [Actinobacteria bacterium]|nr:2-phospho-L-lactate transferase [Actinomycetota bacterium]
MRPLDPGAVVLTVLAGGIGAARFLRGLVRAADPRSITTVVNVGDDIELHGLRVCPDLDTITYTLADAIHPEQQWGRADESFTVADELRRYGEQTWFTLGDRDLATHLYRTRRLHEGAPLSQVTEAVARAWGLAVRLIPATDDRVWTRITTADDRALHFQEYWVRERAEPEVAHVELVGADSARPAPGVLGAIASAEVVVLCPSNPVVSIGTILAVPGIREALVATDAPVVGVSPIVGGEVVRGMADRLLPAVGAEVSAAGVAELYRDFLDGWVIDDRDADAVAGLRTRGLAVAVTDTVMRTPEVAERVARTALELAATVERAA